MSATPQLPPVAKLEQKTVVDLVSKGKRIDERGPESYRPIQIQVGLIEKANGSAQVHLGKSKVLAGIKVQTGTPFEISRVVDRGIRESKAIDMKSLVLQKGKTVQVVYVDIYVLDHDGNLIDAASMAALAALVNSKVAKMEVKGDEVINKGGHHQLPLNNYPVAVTFAKVDRTIIVDPSLEEEQVMTARLTVTIDKNGDICAMQKGGLYGFTPDEVRKVVHMAVGKAAENRARIMAAAKG